MINQDRNFAGRLRVWKEGWWKDWTPQLVVGVNDVTSGSGGDYINMGVSGSGNGYFSRYFIAMTKHVRFSHLGELGAHVAYLYNERTGYHLDGVAAGMNFLHHAFSPFHRNGNQITGQRDFCAATQTASGTAGNRTAFRLHFIETAEGSNNPAFHFSHWR